MATSITWPPIGGASYSIPAAGEVGWPALSNFLISLQNAQGTESQKIAVRVATTNPVTVTSATDCVIRVEQSVPGPTTVNLPAGVDGQYFVIIDGLGDASTNNITITPDGAETINGAATLVLDSDYGAYALAFKTGNWSVISFYTTSVTGTVARSDIAAGQPDYVVINDNTGLLSEEQYLSQSRGGMGANVTAFSGVVKAAAGIFSASDIVDGDIDANAAIDATKISAGNVDNTMFDRVEELGRLDCTGILNGGLLSIDADPTKFDLAAGTGYIVDYVADPVNPTYTLVTWSAFNAQTVTNLATADTTYILINSSAAIVQQTSFPTPDQQRTSIFIGRLTHSNRTSVQFANSIGTRGQSLGNQFGDLMDALGPFNIQGNVPSSNGANLTFQVSSGQIFSRYFNFESDPENPHFSSQGSTAPASFAYRTQAGGSTGNVTNIDPTSYDVAGTITAVPGAASTATVQRIYRFPSGNIRVQYGQQTYGNLADAVAGISSQSFTVATAIQGFGVLIGYLAVQKNATDLSDTTRARFLPAARFDSGSGGGSAGVTTLQGAYNNSVTPQIVLTSTGGGLFITDNATPITGDLFHVSNSAGSTKYLEVDTQGLKTSNVTTGARVLVSDANLAISQSTTTTTQVQYLSSATGTTGTPSTNLVFSGGPTVVTPLIDDAADFEQITTPSNPAAGRSKLYPKSDGFFYSLDSSGTETVIGGGGSGAGSLNIVDNPIALSNTTGWTAATNYTVTRNTTDSPLEGVIDTCFAISTTTASSETSTSGVYAASLAMPVALRNTKCQVSIYLTTPATADGVWSLSLYNAGGTRVSLSSDSSSVTTLPGGFNGQFVCTFDADSSATYTVSLTQTTRTNANTLYFTQIVIGNGITAQGAAVGPYESTTSYTITATTTNPTPGTGATYYRSTTREGSYAVIRWEFASAAVGSNGTGDYILPLPTGITIDASRINTTQQTYRGNAGQGYMLAGTTIYQMQLTASPGVSTTGIFASLFNDGTVSTAWASTGVGGFANNPLRFSCEARLPIAEWAGNGTVNLGQGAQVVYVYNSSTTTSDDTTSFATGPAGALIQNFAPSGTTGIVKRVQTPYPVQNISDLVVETDAGTSGAQWVAMSDRIGSFTSNDAGTTYYGAQLTPISSTQFNVTFYSQLPAKIAWSAINTWRWRVRVANPSAPVGFGVASVANGFGLMAPAKGQYAMTVTSTVAGWATARAVGIYYQDQDGNHRLKFNIAGTVTSGTYTGGTWTIDGVTFKNITNYRQAVNVSGNNLTAAAAAFTLVNTDDISVAHASTASMTGYYLSGDVELESRPTWA